jgi:hypothetical protein
MFRLLAGGLTLAILGLCAVPAPADDKDKDKDKVTVWTREVGEVKLRFEIGKDTAKYTVTAGQNGCTATAKIKIEKDVVSSEVTDVDVKGDFPNAPKKGDKVSFKWVAKGDTATLSDLKGENVDEAAKGIIEGEYKKEK